LISVNPILRNLNLFSLCEITHTHTPAKKRVSYAHRHITHAHLNIERFLFLVVQLSFFVFASPTLCLLAKLRKFVSTPNSQRRHLAKHLTAYQHHHAHHHHHQQIHQFQQFHQQHHQKYQQQQQQQQQKKHHQQQHHQQKYQPQTKKSQGIGIGIGKVAGLGIGFGLTGSGSRSASRSGTGTGTRIPRPSRLPSYATATATSATSFASTAQLTGGGGGAHYGSIGSSGAGDLVPAPSLWYSVLALPFDDQKLGRREFSSYGRGYRARAGLFSSSHM